MNTKSEYWKGDQIFNVPQRHVCWRLVLHVSQSCEVIGPFKEGWKLEVFRSLEFLHLGQLQDPQSCPFFTWHEVKDFCLPVGSFLEVCSLTTPQVQDNGTSQSWTRASKSVSQNTPLQSIPGMMHCNTKSQWKFCEAYFERVSVSVLIWRFGEIKCPVRWLPLHLSFLSHYPSLVYVKTCFCSLVTKTVC